MDDVGLDADANMEKVDFGEAGRRMIGTISGIAYRTRRVVGKKAEVAGFRVWCVISGTQEDGDGLGWVCQSRCWQLRMMDINNTYRVCVGLLGLGGKGRREGTDMPLAFCL